MASLAERIALLAPVIVITVGATLFILLLWGKIVRQQLREARHPRLIVGGVVLAVALLVALSLRP